MRSFERVALGAKGLSWGHDARHERRGHGEDSIYWDESRKRYIGAVDLGLSPTGTRIRMKVSGKTKVEVQDKLRELGAERAAELRQADRAHRQRRPGSAGDDHAAAVDPDAADRA
jgi:hypothetical protein